MQQAHMQRASNESGASARIQQQRLCVAAFMDDNPQVFSQPVAGESWASRIATGEPISGRDRVVVDRALGMLAGVFRSAQISLGGAPALTDALAAARAKGLPEFAPDAAALEQADVDGLEDETIAYARSITIYKECVRAGIVGGDELPRSVEDAFDRLPGESPFMRSLIETAKRMAQIDLQYLLAGE
jgi:hypothetical protein